MKKNIFLIIILLSFFIMSDVYAEDGEVNSPNGVNIREQPTTESKIIVSIKNGTRFFISNLNAGTGNGCDNNWYYIHYGNTDGYICSTHIKLIPSTPTSTSYGRPWTSPKKAIIGGADFIGEDYISKGQNTAYLTKFNVNPNAYYRVHNHQYMENLREPTSKSQRNFNTREFFGLLNQEYNFLIPEFLNMPESTYDSKYWNTERNTADIQDEAFEQSIVNFREDYKPYLRYLHTKYPLWTFTRLETKLDFNESVLIQKEICSIEKSTNYCDGVTTEDGWCRASYDAVSFFLDPRNFLSEKHILMFEDLSYSELHTEEVVQRVIKGTFMEDISILDNQKYASIFVEAGFKADVSPLYLATFVIQEIGYKTSPTFTTSGEEFEYEGYTYSGLYNFFNIGASSSASNPAKAGLVYANGGKGFNNGFPNGNINFLEILKVNRINSYIKGYALGTNVQKIKNTVGNNYTIIVKNELGNIKKENDLIATGNRIEISDGITVSSFIYVMKGDLNGDGEINSADLLRIRQHLLGTNKLTGSYLSSALLTNTDEVNSADLLKIRQHLLGIINIEQ